MAGMFDDLIPQAPPQAAAPATPAQSGGMFDDLIPQAPAAVPHGGVNAWLPEGLRQFADAADDYGTSLSKGMVGLGEAAVGLGNIVSGGGLGNLLEEHAGWDPAKRRQELEQDATPGYQAAQQAVRGATGFGDTLRQLRQNPSLIPHAIAEALPGMAMGGLVGRGVGAGAQLLGRSAGIAAPAIGEGVVGAGQQAEKIRQETGTLDLGGTAAAIGTGAATGLLGAAGAKLGRMFGIADIDAQLAGQRGVEIARGLVSRVLGGGGLESVEEMGQSSVEQLLGNIATGKPWAEGIGNAAAMGGVVGGAMGGAAGVRRPHVATDITQGQSAPGATAQDPGMIGPLASQIPGQVGAQAQGAPVLGPMQDPNTCAPVGQPSPLQPPTAPPAADPLAPIVPSLEQAAPTPFAGSQDINPLLDRLGVQGDQRAQTLDLLSPVEQDVEASRRGTLPLQEQQRLAEMIGLKGAKKLTFERKIGDAWNSEQTLAVTNHVRSQLTDVLTRQSSILDGTASDIDRAQFVAGVQSLRQGFGELMGARAEAGRALAAYRRDIQNIRQAQDILEQVGGAAGADAIARAIGQAMKSGGVPAAARAIGHEGWGNKLLGRYWRAALLTSPSTHITNVSGNIGMLALEVIERGAAAGIGAAKRKLTGGKSGQTVFAEPLQLVLGAAQGQLNAYRAANTAWETGESAILGGGIKEPGQTLSLKPETMGGKIDYALTMPYRMLAVQDAFMAQVNFEGELRALAYQQAQAEKRSGQLTGKVAERVEELLANPPADLIEASTQHARVQTFNQAGGPLVNAINGAKRKFPLLELISPFVRTPRNLAVAAIKRTPLAAFAPSVHEDIKAGGARQERALARIGVGTSFMILAGALAQAGRITGAGPDDPEEKRALLNSGWQAYSFRTEDGQYVQYSRGDPFSSLLSLAADLATTKWKDSDASDLVARVIGSFAESFVSKTFMSGVSDLLEMMAEPKRKAGTWLDRTGAGLLQPFSIISRAAQADDPYARESDGLLDALKYRLPGLRRELNQKLDAFGFPVANPGFMGEGWPSWAAGVSSPTRITEESKDPVRLEAKRLSWSPGAPTGYITHKGERHELTPEQHHEFRALAGHMIYVGTARLMRSREYQALTDSGKLDALQKLEQKARSAVRLAMLPAVVSGNRSALERLQQRTDAALQQIRGAQ